MPIRNLATLSAPVIGRRAADLTPPPSVSRTASGARRSISCWRSPVAVAVKKLSMTSRLPGRSAPTRGRLACTCPRARALPHRGARFADGVSDLVMGEAEYLAQHEHRTLIRGQRVEHDEHGHPETESASTASSAMSGVVSSGSARSHGPTNSPRRRCPTSGACSTPGGPDPHQVGARVPYGDQVGLGPAAGRSPVTDVLGIPCRAGDLSYATVNSSDRWRVKKATGSMTPSPATSAGCDVSGVGFAGVGTAGLGATTCGSGSDGSVIGALSVIAPERGRSPRALRGKPERGS